MSHKVEIEIFTFDELSDRAKDKARARYRDGIAGDTWAIDTLLDNTVTDAARLLGIEFVRRGAYPAIDWNTNPIEAAFNGSWRASKVAADKLRAEFPQDQTLHTIADDLERVAASFPDASADCSIGRGCFQRVAAEMNPEDDSDESETDDAGELVVDSLQSFAHWIACAVDREIDYQNSDEVIDETICVNEYEFTADGSIY